jgi:hypothetical protein
MEPHRTKLKDLYDSGMRTYANETGKALVAKAASETGLTLKKVKVLFIYH